MSWWEKYRRWVLLGGGLGLLVILIVSAVGIWWNAANSVKLMIMVTPLTATVRVGETEYGAMGEYKIMPGVYEVEVKAEGFKSRTGELVAVEGSEVEVSLYLEPEEGNEKYYAEHPDDALILGELKNAETLRKLAELKEAWPILNELPIEIEYYTKNYAKLVKYTVSYVVTEEAKNGFKIVVTDYTGGNYADAVAKLKSCGAEVEKLEIEYKKVRDDEWGKAE